MVPRTLIIVLAISLAFVVSVRADDAKSIQDRFDKEIKPLLARYCGDCHFDGVSKGDLDLERFTTLVSVQNDRVAWRKVADNLLTKSMPPAKKTQPSDDERNVLQAWVRDALEFCDCTGPRDPGRVVIRRLNRNEYDNTIRDLLGITDFNPAADFPADDSGYGFDNIGDVLTMSPLLVEKYLAAADQLLDRVIVADPLPPAPVAMFPGNRLEGSGRGFPRTLSTEGEAYRPIEFPTAGRYEIRVEASADQAGDEPARMMLRIDDREVTTIDVDAPRRTPRTYKAEVQLTPGSHRVAVAFVNDYWDPAQARNQRDRNLIIHKLTVVGPLDAPFVPSPLHQRIIFVQPGQDGLSEEQAASRVLEQFASRAYRRPVSTDEVAKLVALFKTGRSAGDNYAKAMKLALSGVLVSPNFLFRIEEERSDDPDKPYLIGEHELATRLSYFLWSSMPDEALTAAAASGKLRDPDALRAQAARMLADSRSEQFVQNFVGQWLVMRNLEHHSVSRERYPSFNENLRDDMVREVELFFANLIREDRSVLELLDSDYTFVNERLATLYQLKEEVKGNDDFRRVSLKGTPRGGVLTMAGVLTVTAMPSRTSPVKRGKFVLEQILATPPPPPPPNTPGLSERRDDIRRGSVRERFEAHRSESSCITCHARMDPIGFALENFDAIGGFREDDRGFPIDASGALPEGDTFNGPVELRKLLLAKKDEFVQALVEKMLTYALGRGLTNNDRCTVKDIAGEVAGNDYKFSSLVNAIVSSDAFQKRRAKRPGE